MPNFLREGAPAISKLNALDLTEQMYKIAGQMGLEPHRTILSKDSVMLTLEGVYIFIENDFEDGSRPGATLTLKYSLIDEDILHKDYFLYWDKLRKEDLVSGGPFILQGEIERKKPAGKSGRPHKDEDVWAWNEIYHKHRPKAQVEKEWLEKIKYRDLVDPDSQFKRISNRKWGDKSGQ